MAERQHVIVASHRRSGTHLTIDSLVNNFPDFAANPPVRQLTLDHLAPHVTQADTSYPDICAKLQRPCVLKTHAHGEVARFFPAMDKRALWVRNLFEAAKIIYVRRDGRDVLVSLYHYVASFRPEIKQIAFGNFLRMNNDFDSVTCSRDLDRVSYLAYHVQSWLNRPNVFVVAFEDFLRDYEGTLRAVAKFLNMPLRRRIVSVVGGDSQAPDFRQRLRTWLGRPVQRSSVAFRQGTSGSWKDYFSSADLAFFAARANVPDDSLRKAG